MHDPAPTPREAAARVTSIGPEEVEVDALRRGLRARDLSRPSALVMSFALLGAVFGSTTGGDQRLLSAVLFGMLFAMGAWVLRFVVGLVRDLINGAV